MTLGLVLCPPAAELELAADALWSLGAVAVEERTGAAGVELWTSLGEDRDAVLAALPQQWPYRFEELDDAVADTWRAFATPTEISESLLVVPAWLDAEPAPGQRAIRIEPGATFGMGDHPTTVLCLRAIEQFLQAGGDVLDVGCGSGVLAIAALCMGAANAVAVDINPASVAVARANAERNGVALRLTVSTQLLDEFDQTFGLVVANILAPALVQLAPDLRRMLARSGQLIVSGLLDEAYQHVVDALWPLQVQEVTHLDPWVALTLRWPGQPGGRMSV